jgi:hypothetical protein
MEVSGLLYSQIGYDLKDPMRALIRSTNPDYVKDGTTFEILEVKSGKAAVTGLVKYWGDIWKSSWWEIDFSQLNCAGEYRIIVKNNDEEICSSDAFKVGASLLWNDTITVVGLDQLEERARRARNKKGWKDCGSDFREVNSHATMVIGLCDVAGAYEWISDSDSKRIFEQIITGCDYIATCQDKAEKIGYPKGAIIHEVPNYMVLIPADVAQGTVAFAKASRLLTEINPSKSDEYFQRAVKAFDYLLNYAEPFGGDGFSHMNHGAPEGFEVPKEFMTRDLLMMMWGGIELWVSGQSRYKEDVLRLARQVMKRQVRKDKPEGEFYGHFYTFDSCDFTEKANTHHHIGHDTGSTFPNYLIPFIEMTGRWYDHPEASLWRETIRNFAYGYFLPACRKNPFYLMPEGYFTGEGILFFCGPWHGINTSICFGAALAAKLASFTGDAEFKKIAVGNIQWIAGLNAGITQESLAGCVFWKENIETGKAVPYSQIHGIGNRSVGIWTDIKGTIPNGFDVNPQFQLVVKPTAEADGPWLYTDEDWIPHAAGWLSALTYLRQYKVYAD